MSMTLERCFRAALNGTRGTIVISSKLENGTRRVWWVEDATGKSTVIDVDKVTYTHDMDSGTQVTNVTCFWSKSMHFDVRSEIPVSPGTKRMSFNQIEVKVPIGIGNGRSADVKE